MTAPRILTEEECEKIAYDARGICSRCINLNDRVQGELLDQAQITLDMAATVAALREENARLRGLFESTPAEMFTPTGRKFDAYYVIYFNDYEAALTPQPKEAAHGEDH